MPEIITYKNSRFMCFSTIKLDNGEKVFISLENTPEPRVSVYKSRLMGFVNSKIWEFTPQMAGGYDAYIRKLAHAFSDSENGLEHPLDAIMRKVMGCESISDVIDVLFETERQMNAIPNES